MTNRLVIAALAAIYLAAIVAANLIITAEGPSATPYVALGLVALDLVARDVLHDRTSGRARIVLIAFLIVAGSVLSYALNADASQIALASGLAFAASLTVDTLVYQAVRYMPWLERSTLSNVASAIIDSAVFIAVAFPGFLWGTFAIQSGMKIAGGVLFALMLERVVAVAVYARA